MGTKGKGGDGDLQLSQEDLAGKEVMGTYNCPKKIWPETVGVRCQGKQMCPSC